MDNFVGEIASVGFIVRCADAEENAQTDADLADDLVGHGDACFGDSLDDNTHGLVLDVHRRSIFN